VLLPSKASEHDHGGSPCPGGRYNRDTAEFVYYMAHIENAARIINWGLYAHHWAIRLPEKERKVIAESSVMRNYGRMEHRKYVNLYFGTHTAMQYVICYSQRVLEEKDLVFLRFDADDLFDLEGAMFSDGNVASNSSGVFSAEEHSKKLKLLIWPVILCQKKSNESAKRVKMAELLIPNYIPPSRIHSAVVLNSEAEEKLIRLIKTDVSEEFLEALKNIEENPEFDSPDDEPPSEPKMEIEIIRDGMTRHFFGRGDGDGGYKTPSLQDMVRSIRFD
jgi:hypothetical protein